MATESLMSATKTLNSKRVWPCKFDGCGLFFKKKDHLSRHELIHTDERPFECNFQGCNKAFRSKSHLKRHEGTHSGTKAYKCDHDGCSVACMTLWNLKRHIKRTHLGSFKCETCDKEFKKSKLYKEHLLLEHKASRFCCEFPGCGQIFTEGVKLKHHAKIHTTKEYSCVVKDCSMKFNLWSECRQHMAQCKNNEKQCDICGKKLSKGSNLKAHRKIHSEDREVFQCTYAGCGRFYTKKYNLKVHCQSFHQNIRPFLCPKDKCKKSFHFKHLLRRHLDNHAANKENKESKKRKPPRVKRKDSLIEGLSGYMPEFARKLTQKEIDAYIEQFGSGAETEPVENESYTTQEEMPPLLTDFTITSIERQFEMDNRGVVQLEFKRIENGSDETVTTMTTDIDGDDLGLLLEPLQSSKAFKIPSVSFNSETTQTHTIETDDKEMHLSVNRVFVEQRNPNQLYSASTTNATYDVSTLEEKLKHIVKQRRVNYFEKLCHIQSITESDSSDSEEKKKKQPIMQRCS